MSETMILELPDSLVQNARTIATNTNRRVEDVIIDWLELVVEEIPVELLPDEQVIALRDMQMSHEHQQELHDLLAQQREQCIHHSAQARLDELLHIYRRGMVRKAQALKVAVERGLQPSLGE